MSATETEAAGVTADRPRYYGFSALISGFAKMWRAAAPALLVIVANAIVQAALIIADPAVGWSLSFILPLILSVAMVLITGAVLSACAYESATGRVSVATAFGRANRHFWLFSGWVILQTIVIWIGLALYTWPGLILSLVLVYIPLAAIAGRGNALGENFRAIGAHPIRWIITGLIISVFLLLGFLLGAVNTFFIGGPVATFAAVFVGGLFGWWWLTTWALLFRSRVEPAPTGGLAQDA